MQPDVRTETRPQQDDWFTVIAIAICAFALTDLAHEGFGHGMAYIMLGGRSLILTTTQLIANVPGVNPHRIFAGNPRGDLYGRIFSIAGPLGNFVLAGIALALLKTRAFSLRMRLLFWLSAAFSLFWAIGYMLYSGITGVGDWIEVVGGLSIQREWRFALVVLGVLFYWATMRGLKTSLRVASKGISEHWYPRLRNILWVSYLSAACIASLGASLDPRGSVRILHDALPETLIANLGMLLMPRQLRNEGYGPAQSNTGIERSIAWIAAAICVSAFYVLILGPGLKLRF